MIYLLLGWLAADLGGVDPDPTFKKKPDSYPILEKYLEKTYIVTYYINGSNDI